MTTIKIPTTPSTIKVEVLNNVVQIECEGNEQIFVQVKRGEKIMQYEETPVCMGKCPKCGKSFSVYFRASDLKCPECVTPVIGFWTFCFVSTWDNDK
jgi:predicted Zn-ribbon and HTH transcriptional regulator